MYRIHWMFRLFFLYVEPLTAFAGFYVAAFQPLKYLQLTDPTKVSPRANDATLTIISQLANLYFYFALVEAFVLRATNELNVWRTLLTCMLVADFGHLFSLYRFGFSQYWSFWNWNEMAFGNIGIVYLGAASRIAFLLSYRATLKKRQTKENR